MLTEDHIETEMQNPDLDYSKSVKKAIGKDFDFLPSSSKDILGQVGDGSLDFFDTEVGKALITRVVGYEFPDRHKGYIVETGGVVSLSTSDEAIFPYIRHCYIVKASLILPTEGPKIVIMHHGPDWSRIPFFVEALKKDGDVSNLTILANSYFQKEDDRAKAVSAHLRQKIGLEAKDLDLDTGDGRSLQLFVRGSVGSLLTIPKDISQVDYDELKYSQSGKIEL